MVLPLPILLCDHGAPHVTLAMAEEDKKESKRRREKERRQEFSEAYLQLSTLIVEVDPCSDMLASELSEGKTRIELIHRSIALIRRLHEENTRLRSRIHASASSSNALDDDVVRRVRFG